MTPRPSDADLAQIAASGGSALDYLCRLDDEFGMEPEDVRWTRFRVLAVSRAFEALRAEVEALRDERDVARAAVEAVLRMHQPRPNSVSALYPDPLCACDGTYPCLTVQAVAAAGYPTETKEDER